MKSGNCVCAWKATDKWAGKQLLLQQVNHGKNWCMDQGIGGKWTFCSFTVCRNEQNVQFATWCTGSWLWLRKQILLPQGSHACPCTCVTKIVIVSKYTFRIFRVILAWLRYASVIHTMGANRAGFAGICVPIRRFMPFLYDIVMIHGSFWHGSILNQDRIFQNA